MYQITKTDNLLVEGYKSLSNKIRLKRTPKGISEIDRSDVVVFLPKRAVTEIYVGKKTTFLPNTTTNINLHLINLRAESYRVGCLCN